MARLTKAQRAVLAAVPDDSEIPTWLVGVRCALSGGDCANFEATIGRVCRALRDAGYLIRHGRHYAYWQRSPVGRAALAALAEAEGKGSGNG